MDFNKVKLLIPIHGSTVAENVWCSSGLKMLRVQNKNLGQGFPNRNLLVKKEKRSVLSECFTGQETWDSHPPHLTRKTMKDFSESELLLRTKTGGQAVNLSVTHIYRELGLRGQHQQLRHTFDVQ